MDPLIAVIALILIVVVVILVVARRPQPQTRPLVSRTPDVIVDAEHAQLPYPYVMVNDDGSVRELTPAERKPLEMAFSPLDWSPYTSPPPPSRPNPQRYADPAGLTVMRISRAWRRGCGSTATDRDQTRLNGVNKLMLSDKIIAL